MWIGLKLGRRRCIIIGDIFVIVGTAVQASSFSVAQIIVARVICVRLPPLIYEEFF
jgi:MFS family permease